MKTLDQLMALGKEERCDYAFKAGNEVGKISLDEALDLEKECIKRSRKSAKEFYETLRREVFQDEDLHLYGFFALSFHYMIQQVKYEETKQERWKERGEFRDHLEYNAFLETLNKEEIMEVLYGEADGRHGFDFHPRNFQWKALYAIGFRQGQQEKSRICPIFPSPSLDGNKPHSKDDLKVTEKDNFKTKQ